MFLLIMIQRWIAFKYRDSKNKEKEKIDENLRILFDLNNIRTSNNEGDDSVARKLYISDSISIDDRKNVEDMNTEENYSDDLQRKKVDGPPGDNIKFIVKHV